MQPICIVKKCFLRGLPPRQRPRPATAEAPAALNVAKLPQVAAACATWAAGGTQPEVRPERGRTLGGGKCGGGGRSGLVHAANQLPTNAAYLHWQKLFNIIYARRKNAHLTAPLD